MPFGCGAVRPQRQFDLRDPRYRHVTNAFRLWDCSPPIEKNYGHFFRELSPMPFGCGAVRPHPSQRAAHDNRIRVTNAFRLWGCSPREELAFGSLWHKALSPMPFGCGAVRPVLKTLVNN